MDAWDGCDGGQKPGMVHEEDARNGDVCDDDDEEGKIEDGDGVIELVVLGEVAQTIGEHALCLRKQSLQVHSEGQGPLCSSYSWRLCHGVVGRNFYKGPDEQLRSREERRQKPARRNPLLDS